jgi:hypothetical protein
MPSLAKKKPAVSPAARAPSKLRVLPDPTPSSKLQAPGGLNFGSIHTAVDKKKKQTDHPTLSLEGEASQLLDQFVEHMPDFKRLEKLVGSKGSIRAQLVPHLRAAMFRHFNGRAIDDSRMLGTSGNIDVKYTFKDQYSKLCLDLTSLTAAVPKASEHFHVVDTLKIEFDKIDSAKQQPLVDAIITAAGKLGIEEGITASKCVQPKPGFHAQRCIIFDTEENIAIDEIIPITAYPSL